MFWNVVFQAYHHVSCRFRTFLLDSECERVECGVAAVDDKRGSLSRHHHLRSFERVVLDDDAAAGLFSTAPAASSGGGGGGGGVGGGDAGFGQSLFDYVDKMAAKSPVFHNFFYDPK